MSCTTKWCLDFLSLGAAFSSFIGWLSPILAFIASTLAIIWMCIQIYDWFKHGRINKD